MLLGQARGKVGSIVFSRLNGRQITRSLAESVKNPRSDGQNVQRAIFATVNAFASAVRDVVDHSWQSTKEGAESVNRFVSINVKKLRSSYISGAAIDLMSKGEGLPYANAYRMSQGSLGLQRLFVGTAPAGQHFAVYQEEDWEGNVDSAAMLQSLIPAFAPGCEIAVVKVYYNEVEHFHYVTKDRAVFLSDFTGLGGENIVTASGIGASYLDPNKTTDAAVLRVVGGNSGNKLLAVSEAIGTTAENNTLVACAVIVSQKDSNGKWIYTTSDMVTVDGWNDAHSLTAAVNSYGNTAASETTSDLYLQQSATEQSDAAVTPIGQLQVAITASQGGENLDRIGGFGYQTISADIAPANTGNVVVDGNIAKGGNDIKVTDITLVHPSQADAAGIINRQINTEGNAVSFSFEIDRTYITDAAKYVEVKVKGTPLARVTYQEESA